MAEERIIDFERSLFYRELEQWMAAGSAEDVEDFLLRTEAKLKEGGRPSLLVAVYNEQGAFYRNAGRFDESIEAFRKGQALTEEVLGHDCRECASLFNNMAGTFRMAGKTAMAIGLYEEALGIYAAIGEEGGEACASVHNNLAVALREAHQSSQAIAHLEQVLEILGGIPGREYGAAIACSNLTSLYQQDGRPKDAERCLNRALELLEKCSEVRNPQYASVLCSLAGYLYNAGQYLRAVEVYRRAAAYTERFYGRNEEYGMICQNIYWAYRRLGKAKEAIVALTEAEEIYKRLFGSESDRTRSVQDELSRIIGSSRVG